MALGRGVRLGPYEVVSDIGAGGMGDVYRARDMRLGREVAIKVLPESFTNDPAQGPIPVDERGIIHRDLKPANIKLTSSGRAELAAASKQKDAEDLKGPYQEVSVPPCLCGS